MSPTTTDALSAEELEGFAALLDAIIPPSRERGLLGAGEAGLAGELDEKTPELRPVLRQGLAALDEKARGRGADGFAALAPAERAATLRELDEADPGFLPGLLYHAYARYYQHPRVLEALGLEARAPFPGGYELEPLDPERLAAVRSRPRFWREC